jgi:hypothetical protein
MRRILLVLSVAALMAAMLVASALPAFAQAGENAGCAGQEFSAAATGLPPGTLGNAISTNAQEQPPGAVGKSISFLAKEPRNACPPLVVIP